MAKIGTRAAWLKARKALLVREKELTHLRDELARARQALPWVAIDADYRFETPKGQASLADLFDGKRQLIVYHFMYGPDWEAPCKSCSFWAEHYDAIRAHLTQRDTNLVVVSRAPLAKLEAFRKRMGWRFPWVSSGGGRFNQDFDVSREPDAKNTTYNFAKSKGTMDEMPGLSVFVKDEKGAIYHT